MYEDETTLAFLDIAPVNKGHVLVILKHHHETLLDVPDSELSKLIIDSKKVCKAMMKGTKADGFNIIMNNYRASGQLVPHAHFHLIPRFSTDGLRHWPQGRYGDGEARKFADKIRQSL